MMARRKLALAVVVLAVAVAASTPILGAVFTRPALKALADVAAIGETTPLLVQVDPALVGGTGLLYAKQEDGNLIHLGKFALEDVHFVLKAPVPGSVTAGTHLTYHFSCDSLASGLPFVSGGATVYVQHGQGTDEPPAWR